MLNERFTPQTRLRKPKIPCLPIISGKHLGLALKTVTDSSFVWHFIPLLNELEKTQAGESTHIRLTLSARALVLEKLLSHTVFDVLRQQRKMGYELGVGYKPIGRYPGIAMYAVSQTHTSQDIYQAICQAIEDAKLMLENDNVCISDVIADLTHQVRPKDTDISQTASRAWLHFEDNNPVLAYTELVDALAAISKDEILKALHNLAHTNLGQITLSASDDEALAYYASVS